ncbi:energy transducer TonB [Maribacter sp. 2308TA10-17]|uniref:energy transducer TonB n=1 Tax=Maribacter sp. 2308TA10-17 TaxID=3386276 RepID=UPI0039BCF772
MKQRILIFCMAFTALGLTAFGVINWSDSETDHLEATVSTDVAMNMPIEGPESKEPLPDFSYDVGTRFRPMKKEKLHNATSIHDFFYAEEIQEMVVLESVDINMIKNERPSHIHEIGYTKELNEAQLKLIQTFDYSSNFAIRAEFKKVNTYTGMLVDEYSNPHITIVPEKQAEYVPGKNALITYLRENSKEAIIDVQKDKLRPAKLYFTVTKNGGIENVRLDNHSGYPEVDKKMMELISNVPGSWEPAENINGEKVNQELVISYGLMGC